MVVATYANELSEEGFTCLAFDPGHVQTDMGGESVRPLPILFQSASHTLNLNLCFPQILNLLGPFESPREHQEHDRQDRRRFR